jgi:hypothetical protein
MRRIANNRGGVAWKDAWQWREIARLVPQGASEVADRLEPLGMLERLHMNGKLLDRVDA